MPKVQLFIQPDETPAQARTRERLVQYDQNVAEARALFAERNVEYGDSFASWGLMGTGIELTNCTARLHALLGTMSRCRYDEPLPPELVTALRNVFKDSINYANMSLMMLDEDNRLGDGLSR